MAKFVRTASGGFFMFVFAMSGAMSGAVAGEPADRDVYFGETHLHTVLSFDSYVFGNRNSPDDAYRYARGEAIRHPAGFEMKIDELIFNR